MYKKDNRKEIKMENYSILTGRLTSTKTTYNRNGVDYVMFCLAVDHKNKPAEYYNFSLKAENKQVQCMGRGKQISVAFSGIYTKTSDYKGRTYKSQYLNNPKVSFVAEKKFDSFGFEEDETEKAAEAKEDNWLDW